VLTDTLFFRLALAFEAVFFRNVGLVRGFFAVFAFSLLCVAFLFEVMAAPFDFFCLLLLFFLLGIAAVYHRGNAPENGSNSQQFTAQCSRSRLSIVDAIRRWHSKPLGRVNE
jgi:succinate-acetate transporter protein